MPTNDSTQPDIPEDLREQHELNLKWLAMPWNERPKTGPGVEAILRENSVNDVRRLARLETQLASVKADRDDLREYHEGYKADSLVNIEVLTQDTAALRAENERLKAPVQFSECESDWRFYDGTAYLSRAAVDALISHRGGK
jgi:hypothetical protein